MTNLTFTGAEIKGVNLTLNRFQMLFLSQCVSFTYYQAQCNWCQSVGNCFFGKFPYNSLNFSSCFMEISMNFCKIFRNSFCLFMFHHRRHSSALRQKGNTKNKKLLLWDNTHSFTESRQEGNTVLNRKK